LRGLFFYNFIQLQAHYKYQLIKSVLILFIACFLSYLPFSRTPDYFDSDTTPALIEAKVDSVFAVFKESGKTYRVQLDQKRFQSSIGTRIEIRYELSAPQHAKVNQLIGYWLEPKELLGALSILIFLLIAAYATTHRPDPASLKEQIEFKKEDTGKYV
jgi:hypothetical protein